MIKIISVSVHVFTKMKQMQCLKTYIYFSVAQNYINCTRQCLKPTICTEYKYNIGKIKFKFINIQNFKIYFIQQLYFQGGIWRAECYQCESADKDGKHFNKCFFLPLIRNAALRIISLRRIILISPYTQK